MPDYSKSKIYKIYNIQEPEKFYIGGTSCELWRRLGAHKTLCKKASSFFYTEVKRFGWSNFKIELVKNFPCNCRQELLAEEERIRSLMNAYYNTNRAVRTEEQKQEYYNNNKEKMAKRMAEYYKKNKEQITERRRERKRECK